LEEPADQDRFDVLGDSDRNLKNGKDEKASKERDHAAEQLGKGPPNSRADSKA
jgi:hypothetical protein